jgi:hypothetical protein
MSSSFLFNATLWSEISTRVQPAKKVGAAIAYLGSGGARILPLRSGDRLVVDMSLRSVRAGSTDPREVKKLLRKGVEVFSRPQLHTKFLVIDTVVIAGSANISLHARGCLDEAAILTDDPAVLCRAQATLEQLCTEPVRKDYLETCIREYRPPLFAGQARGGVRRRRKVVEAKLWLIAGLAHQDVPEREKDRTERATKKLTAMLVFERSEVNYLHYPGERKFFAQLRVGDWAIQCFSNSRGFEVLSPARFLGRDAYPRRNGKQRQLLFFEESQHAEAVTWSALRRAAPNIAALQGRTPRTKPIPSDSDADAILRLWDSRGRFRSKRR